MNERHAKQTTTLQRDLMLRFREADVRDRQLRVASGSSTNDPLWNAHQSLKADRSRKTAKLPILAGSGGAIDTSLEGTLAGTR